MGEITLQDAGIGSRGMFACGQFCVFACLDTVHAEKIGGRCYAVLPSRPGSLPCYVLLRAQFLASAQHAARSPYTLCPKVDMKNSNGLSLYTFCCFTLCFF